MVVVMVVFSLWLSQNIQNIVAQKNISYFLEPTTQSGVPNARVKSEPIPCTYGNGNPKGTKLVIDSQQA